MENIPKFKRSLYRRNKPIFIVMKSILYITELLLLQIPKKLLNKFKLLLRGTNWSYMIYIILYVIIKKKI